MVGPRRALGLASGLLALALLASGCALQPASAPAPAPVPLRPLPGRQPRLQPAEVQDLIAFLCTLTDGYDPSNPAAASAAEPAQCRAVRR